MSTQDLSRRTHDVRYNRRALLAQVGRILTDEDITAIGDIAADERAADRLGIIGAHGTSNDGFKVLGTSVAGGVIDLSLAAGDYWIGGQRAQLHLPTSFRLQPDWLTRPDLPAPAGERHDLAVLEIFTQPVGATEQEAAADPGLGGVDTAAHLRVIARVRLVTDLGAGACHDLWAAALARWQAAGAGTLLPATHALEGDGTLQVGFTDTGAPEDLCAPGIAQGFLGAANRAIRVQMVTPDRFCWGFENGGRLLRATRDAAGTGLTLLTDPVDEAHWPAMGQVVEVLPWGAVDFNGEKIAAETEGHFTTVAAGFDPDTRRLTLAEAPPAGFNSAWAARPDADRLRTTRFDSDPHPDYVFVRLWDRGADRSSPATLGTGPGVALGQTGLTVTHAGSVLRPGDAWIIAARPFAPDDIAPWELRVGAAPVDRRRLVAPLAHIHWNAPGGGTRVHDCRARFRPLTRQGDCVTLRVGDGTASHGDYRTLQEAVAALPAAGGRILVLPGRYPGHVRIDGGRDIRIEGCGPRSRLEPAPAADGVAADTPVLTIAGATGVQIKDLAIAAPAQLAVAAISGTDANGDAQGCRDVALEGLQITHFRHGGIWLAGVEDARIRACICRVTRPEGAGPDAVHRPSVHVQGARITVADCTLTGTAPDSDSDTGPALVPALGGLRIGGGTDSARVTGTLIEGCQGHGITLGTVIHVPAEALGSDTRMMQAFRMAHGTIGRMEGFSISRDNCVGLDPVPPVRDPDGSDTPMVAIPDGRLSDIVIADNRIRHMGGNGIGVGRFFNLDVDPFVITVEDLAIIGNEITGVLAGENLPFPPEMQLVAAWGGIALADIARAEIRENRIAGNARRHDLPAVGIFALTAEDLEVVENTITDTGLRADEIDGDGAGGGGWRGGIAVTQVRPGPARPPDADDGPTGPERGTVRSRGTLRSDGSSALVVHGNSVRAPQGRALAAFGIGPMQVTDNRLVTQTGASDGWVLAFFSLRRFGHLSLAGLMLNALLIALEQGQRPNASVGHLMLSVLGGDVVALANLGVSNELYLQSAGLSGLLLEADREADFTGPGRLKVGGDIMLNDNQIRLDGLDGLTSVGVSAVMLASLDSVMVQSNQISLDLDADFIGMNLLALGWTVHASQNRLKEPMFNCFVSALTLGVMNTTALNQATHCVLPFGPARFRHAEGNTELIELLPAGLFGRDRSLCDTLRETFLSSVGEDLGAAGGFFSVGTRA
ncbi:MAG: hypothetical protein ACXIU8_13815 [Alkalilacustris sp.]